MKAEIPVEQILRYVAREGSCTPDEAALVPCDSRDDERFPVYKVTVKEWINWKVPPPPFFFVCPYPAMNLYRSDSHLPDPWKSEQDVEAQAEYVRSFHAGLMLRLGRLGQR